MATGLPYKAEYAKSGRAGCKMCKTPIEKGSLRLAIMVQSRFHDGKDANWFHDQCFFQKHRPKTVGDIEDFESLRYDDQKMIKAKIEAVGAGPSAGSSKRKGAAKGGSGKGPASDFLVGYAKSNRSTCIGCEEPIPKSAVRVSKKDYTSEQALKFYAQEGMDRWYHLDCFVKLREELEFFSAASKTNLPGFKDMEKEDQEMLKKKLPAIKPKRKLEDNAASSNGSGSTPAKKIKTESGSKADKSEEAIRKQNKEMYKNRDSAENELKKAELLQILSTNKQTVPEEGGLKAMKIEMLDNLMEIELAYELLSEGEGSDGSIDSHYKKLNADIDIVEAHSEEFKVIKKYLDNTHAPTHTSYTLEIDQVFKVTRKGENQRYRPFKELPNRRLLWHGSRVSNFAGIVSQGLRIAPPEAPVTGYIFGKGIYFADMVTKSANYCNTSRDNPTGLLLLCEVALGEMHELKQAKETISKPPKSKHSVKGLGQTVPDPDETYSFPDGVMVPYGKPTKSKDKDTVLLYNEYIVYDVAQVNIKYLTRVNFVYNNGGRR